MTAPILRTKTTGKDILLFDRGDDYQATYGEREYWFTVWPDDLVASAQRAVEQTADRMRVEIVEFSAPLAG